MVFSPRCQTARRALRLQIAIPCREQFSNRFHSGQLMWIVARTGRSPSPVQPASRPCDPHRSTGARRRCAASSARSSLPGNRVPCRATTPVHGQEAGRTARYDPALWVPFQVPSGLRGTAARGVEAFFVSANLLRFVITAAGLGAPRGERPQAGVRACEESDTEPMRFSDLPNLGRRRIRRAHWPSELENQRVILELRWWPRLVR